MSPTFWPALFPTLLFVIYIGTVLLVIYLVISALRRISAATEDIAQTLQRIEHRQFPPVAGPPTAELQ